MKKMMFLIFTVLLFTVVSMPNAYPQGYTHRATLTGHTGSINAVAFSPDSTTLVSGSSDSTIRLWSVETGEHEHTFTGHENPVWAVAFNPDGETLASGSDLSNFRFWNVFSGQQTRSYNLVSSSDEVVKETIKALAFSPSGKTLARGYSDGTIWLNSAIYWGSTGGGIVGDDLDNHSSSIATGGLAFSPDGRTLASASYDETVVLWNIEGGRGTYKRTLRDTDAVFDVVFSPDGQTLASCGAHDGIRLWDANTGRHKKTLWGHRGDVAEIAFSPDGKTIASGSLDHTIRLWDANTGGHKATLTGHTDGVVTLAFSPDGRTLASGSWDHTIRLWNTNFPIVSIAPSVVESPAVGEQFVIDIDISNGQNITGYGFVVSFDRNALRYVSSSNGNYLPSGAFVSDPEVVDGTLQVEATTFIGVGNGDGTLASLTFEVVDVTTSRLYLLWGTRIVKSDRTHLSVIRQDGRVVQLEDVNWDGIVDVDDLLRVATFYGKSIVYVGGKNPDVNGDGVVNVQDILLVTTVLDGASSAPLANPQAVSMLTAAEVQKWLTHAKQLKFTDATMQRGVAVLEQLLATLMQVEAIPEETVLLPKSLQS